MAKIELRGVPHRRVAVADIEKNPHRDLTANPVNQDRVKELLESFERTGFWDNIVVREHPTKDSKYQLAYGHNRLTALKSSRVDVDTITIPVAKLTDWEMYCAMVDENEMQGDLTPAIVFENINVGCGLIEDAMKAAGPESTFEDFDRAIGRVVPRGTTRPDHYDHGFEQARNAWFKDEGLGRRFVASYLPCGEMRKDNISEVLNERYAEKRAEAAKRRAAEEKEKAKEKRKRAKSEADPNKRKKLDEEAEEADRKAKELEAAAKKISHGKIAISILMMFKTPAVMTAFGQSIRSLRIPIDSHKEAADAALKNKFTDHNMREQLDVWWDEASGAAEERRKESKRKADMEKFKKATRGRDFNSFVVKFAESVKNLQADAKEIIKAAELVDQYSWKAIEKDVIPTVEILEHLIEQTRAAFLKMKDITPATKMLSHQRS